MERSDEYMSKLIMDALDKEVILDAHIEIIYSLQQNKLKALCKETQCFVQFPTRLRKAGKRFMADVIKQGGNGKSVYYRAYVNSIRAV